MIAARLQHRWAGPEHLLLAILSEPSEAARALAACGVDYDGFRDRVAALPAAYTAQTRIQALAPDELAISPTSTELLARAEGLAIAEGASDVGAHHVLLSLLWDQSARVARRLLEEMGATPEELLAQLAQEGITAPNTPPRALPEWGPLRRISQEEFAALAADLTRREIPYRFGAGRDHIVISIAKADDKNLPDDDLR